MGMLNIRKGKQNKARRMMIYGENGVGKSTLASSFPKPLVLNIEDGVGDLDVDSTDVIKSTCEFMEWLVHLYDSDYETVVVDTVDWLEKIVFAEVASKAGKSTIEEIGFGKGYQAVDREWQAIIKGFTALWNQNRHIVLVAHAKVAKFKDPEGDAYDHWTPSLHDSGSGLLIEWCDELLFAKVKTRTIQKDEGFGTKRALGIGGDERVLQCQFSAAAEAKNRLNLPKELPLNASDPFGCLRPFITERQKVVLSSSAASGNVAGLVVDGSSKVGV